MSANTQPIFAVLPNVGFAPGVTAANTAKDGTGTTDLIFTAGANGSFVSKIKIRPRGTNVASVARFFLNNGSTPATATNNMLFDEVGLPATTNSEVAAIVGNELPMNIALPAGWRIYVTLGTAVAGGYAFTTIGGDY
jgi:hypothetical protein